MMIPKGTRGTKTSKLLIVNNSAKSRTNNLNIVLTKNKSTDLSNYSNINNSGIFMRNK